MRHWVLAGVALMGLTVAACGDKASDDVVQVPADGGAPVTVSEDQAKLATQEAALALGLTRKQLEDADLVAANGADLGDVEALVMDGAGRVTQVVVELDGPEDIKVQVPLDKVRAHQAAGSSKHDLATDLTPAELKSLPRWTVTAG